MANALLSVVKLNGTLYDLKDAEARKNLKALVGEHAYDALGTAAWKAVASEVGDNENLPTAAQVKAYVDAQVGAIPGFDVIVVKELPVASKETFHKIYLMAAETQKLTLEPDLYDEFITVRTTSAEAPEGYTYSWEKIGSTRLDLTDYVKKNQTIASIALDHNITDDELKNALGLKALAYKASAQGSVTVAQGINPADYTPAGKVASSKVNVTSTAIKSTGNVTATGKVTGTTVAKGDVNITLGEEVGDTAATVARGNYTPAGTVSVSLNNNVVQSITGVGSQASFKEGAFVAATLDHSESTFAVAGITANVEGETLELTNAGTAQASLVNSFNGGSKAADEFTANTLPTRAEVTVGVDSASFTGTEEKELKVTGVTYKKQTASATFSGKSSDLTAAFAGDEVPVNVSGNYDKVDSVDSTFTGTPASIAPTLQTGSVTVTVE